MLVKSWYQEEGDSKDQVGVSMYTIVSFIPPMQNLTVMLSRLLGEADSTLFKAKWIPLAHGVISSRTVFNWARIMSANILKALERAIPRLEAKGSPLYFYGFLVDALCASN